MAELASSPAEQPASKITFEVNLETNEVEVKYKGNPTWTHITKWNCGVVPATDDLRIDKELHKIKTLRKTFHDNLRVTLTRIRNRIHYILFVFGHDNLNSAFQMAIKVDGVKATISKFLQEIDPNLRNSSLSCWVGEQNESSEQDNKNSDEKSIKSGSVVFSVTDNREGCTSETDWTCSFEQDEFEIDLTSSRRTFTRLRYMFENSYRSFLKRVRLGSLIIECEHQSREDALEMMKNHIKVKATILECLYEMDPRVTAIKVEVEYREIEKDHPQLPEAGEQAKGHVNKEEEDKNGAELKQLMAFLTKQQTETLEKLNELQQAQMADIRMSRWMKFDAPQPSESTGFFTATETMTVVSEDQFQATKDLSEAGGGYEDEEGVSKPRQKSESVIHLTRQLADLKQELKATTERMHRLETTLKKAPGTDTGSEPGSRDTPQGSDQPSGASSHPSEMEALRPGATQEFNLHATSREEKTRKSGTPLGPDTRATPTPARRDPEADRDLLDASMKGSMAAVKRILAAGRADVNCRGGAGRTPVMWAARWGHRDVVELLVSEGADVSLVDKYGDNILHYACWGGDVETVKYVLSLHVVDINSRGWRSMTPVMAAAVWGHRDVVELLVKEGADVSLVDEDGDNILHSACWGGDVETVKCVLSLNVVDIDARNNAGLTAADMARRRGHQEVVKLL